ncbi:MAG: hypothetical protein ACXVI4_08805, partial [Halobacteriota archaeon]
LVEVRRRLSLHHAQQDKRGEPTHRKYFITPLALAIALSIGDSYTPVTRCDCSSTAPCVTGPVRC